MNIGNKIVELRKKHNLSQENLSEKIGVTRQTLSSWENNITSPNLEQAVSLSKELQISLDELVDNKIGIVCKNNTKNSLLHKLVGKICTFEFNDDYFDVYLNHKTTVKVLDINNDFIKIEYQKKKETVTMLIDIDLIRSVTVLEEE